MWPQIVLIVLVAIGMGIEMTKDGQPKTGNHSFVYGSIGNLITLTLLYFGGFFDCFFK